jgi:hypothetical protein
MPVIAIFYGPRRHPQCPLRYTKKIRLTLPKVLASGVTPPWRAVRAAVLYR